MNEKLLPCQLSGTVEVGPAYRTFEEAFVNKAHANCHIAEVLLYDENHTELAHWWEVSESLGVKGVGRAGDTEQKTLIRVNLQPKHTLKIHNTYNPYPIKQNCNIAMQNTTKSNNTKIIYRTY